MPRPLLCTMLLTASLVCSGKPGFANEMGTVQEAAAMLARAVTAVNSDKTAAIAKFNHNDSAFRDRDLFVFCFNERDGKFTAHEAFVGHDVRTLVDPAGKHFGAEMFAAAQEGVTTEVAFLSPVPGSIAQATKRALIARISDQVCGVSVFSVPSKPTQ